MVVLRNKKNTEAEPKTDPLIMTDSPNTDKNQETHLITGAGGHAGFWLGKRLAGRGHKVILVDITEPVWLLKAGMEFHKCDLTDGPAVMSLCRGVDCVYHMASYGMSGREQLNRSRIEAVNVGGTDNVIRACQKNNVTRLVYTSTYNTIFGGQIIENGDESLPYLPLDKHPDHYSRTKSVAEQMILAANGTSTEDGNILHTCALRLAAIYGPADRRHIPRIVKNIEQGLFCIVFNPKSLQDFLHVDNLAQAHDLAGQALTKDKEYIGAGQAYFIADDAPMNTFTFFKPLIVGLGYPMPKLKIPVSVIYFIAFLTECIHHLVSGIYNFQPLLTRTEVYKTGVTHYFSIKKAREELGYKPSVQNDMSEVVQHYIRTGHKVEKKKTSFLTNCLVNVTIGMIFAFLIMAFIPVVT